MVMVHLNSQINEFGHEMIEIKKVRTQIVAGMNYDIELTSGFTDCKKEVVNDNCALTGGDVSIPFQAFFLLSFRLQS